MISPRVAGLPDWPEWMEKRAGAHFIGVTLGVYRKLMEGGYLPPRRRDTKPHQWKRTDLSAFMELRRLGLFADYKQLVQAHGEAVAWEVMLRRLDTRRAEIRSLAEGVR